MIKDKRKMAVSQKIVFAIAFIIFVIHVFTLLFSIGWGFISSLKTQKEFSINSPLALPEAWRFKNYVDAFTVLEVRGVKFFGLIGNSLWYAIGSPLIQVTIAMIEAYLVVRYKCWYTRFLHGWKIVNMIINIGASSAAVYKLMATLHLIDSPLFLIGRIGSQMFTYLIFHAAWRGIAWDYAEAAKIDGAGHWTTLFSVMLPQVLGIWATLFIMEFITCWNDATTSMTYFPNMPTLAQGLYEYEAIMVRQVNMPVYFAGLILGMIPVLTLFFIFQDMIMEKVYIGGIKG